MSQGHSRCGSPNSKLGGWHRASLDVLATQQNIIEPSEDAKMDEALKESPKGSDQNAENRNGIAIEAVELRQQICEWLKSGNAKQRAYGRDGHATRTINCSREREFQRVEFSALDPPKAVL